jgi:hypothetical protein
MARKCLVAGRSERFHKSFTACPSAKQQKPQNNKKLHAKEQHYETQLPAIHPITGPLSPKMSSSF